MNQENRVTRESIFESAVMFACIQVAILGCAGWLFQRYFPLNEAHIIPFAWSCLIGLWILSLVMCFLFVSFRVRAVQRENDTANEILAKQRAEQDKRTQAQHERDLKAVDRISFEQGEAAAHISYLLPEISFHLSILCYRFILQPLPRSSESNQEVFFWDNQEKSTVEISIQDNESSQQSCAFVTLRKDRLRVIHDPKVTVPQITRIQMIEEANESNLNHENSPYHNLDVSHLRRVRDKISDIVDHPLGAYPDHLFKQILENAFLVTITAPPEPAETSAD